MSRVLVVEDSPTQAEELRLLLEDDGFEVAVAAHGLDAGKMIGQFKPDIVVTDLEMPHINGLQLVELIHSKHAGLPVVLMTAFGSEDIAATALRKGAASYVPKAYLVRDIVPTLNRILAVTQVYRFHFKTIGCLTQTESLFALDNDPADVAPIIGHVEELLVRFKFNDATERMRTAIALQEALLNGMYHGNLEVSTALRQHDENSFYDLVEKRRHEAPYRSRRVHLHIKLTRFEALFVVRDEGPGFDPSILPDPDDPTNMQKLGGRGLLLIRTFMDNVCHNSIGNEITLLKRRDPPSDLRPHRAVHGLA